MANIVSNTPYIKLIDKSDRGSEMNVQEKWETESALLRLGGAFSFSWNPNYYNYVVCMVALNIKVEGKHCDLVVSKADPRQCS